MRDLHAGEGTSRPAGCLPTLVQLPVFSVMYRLFPASRVGGEANELLRHRLGAAPLGERWADALRDGGVFGAQGLVHLGLFAVLAAVTGRTYRRARGAMRRAAVDQETAPGVAGPARVLPLLSFGTLLTAALVPPAAGPCLATTTTWTAVERALPHRDRGTGDAGGGATGG